MESCLTCGMPFEGNHENDVGLETAEGSVCKYDVDEQGNIKSPEKIFMGGVEFFAGAAANGDKELAARITRKNMKALPYWQAHHFAELDGEQATEEEFAVAMAKM